MEGEEHFDVAEWHIENFSCWNANVHGPVIVSTIPGRSFYLYPRGRSGKDEHFLISICDSVHLGDISLIGSDGTLIGMELVHPKGKYVYALFKLRFEDVISQMRRNGDEHEDRLIVRYRCKSHRSNYFVSNTIIGVIDQSLKINPEVFGSGENIYSTIWILCPDAGYQIVDLKSLLKGDKTELLLCPQPPLSRFISVKSSVSFRSNDETLKRCEEKEHVFKDSSPCIIVDSIQMKEIIEKRITLLLRLKFINGCKKTKCIHTLNTKEVSVVPNNSSTCFSNRKPSKKVDPVVSIQPENALRDLSKELMCLYQDQDFSDFQLKCDNVSFPAHKNILSARSPVLKTMFSTDMKEAASGCMDIEDLDAPTLTRFLAFLYTGVVEDLQCDRALKLYYAADKYQVPSLKRECAHFLCSNISVLYVCDILSLAHKHQDDSLTSAAHNFILENFNDVLRSQEWKSFMKSEPLLAVETVTHFADKNLVKRS